MERRLGKQIGEEGCSRQDREIMERVGKLATRIDVMIPSFNGEAYIGEAIRSVLDQTFKALRVVVIDNCSTDGTLAVAGSYSDGRLHVVKNDKNVGMVENFNCCIENAKSEYVLIMHADDCLSSGMVEEVVGFFDANPGVGLVLTGGIPINERGEVAWLNRFLNRRFRSTSRTRVVSAGTDGVVYIMRHGVIISGVVVRKEVYRQIGGFSVSMPYSADEEMWVRIASRYPIGVIGRRLVRERVHSMQFRYETWAKADFFEQYCAIRRRCYEMLSQVEKRKLGGEVFLRNMTARAALIIACRLIARNEPVLANIYLYRSKNINPEVVWSPLYLTVHSLLRVQGLGQRVCRRAFGFNPMAKKGLLKNE